MIPLFQIPRNSLLWLLAAQTLLIIPHLPRLPIWIFLAWLIAALWRVQIFRGKWAFPNRWIKGLLVILCLAGLLGEYGRLFGLEPMVGLLLTTFLLKLLEMRRKRDALLVIFLGYFVAATQFLFSQTVLTAAYVVFTVIVLTTALLGVQQSSGHRYPWRSFRLAGALVLQSLPLMLVLFLIMPRIGSLWAVPQQEHSAKTGVSDSMSPGDFTSLVQDDAMAFRVAFDDEIPPSRLLYWRGLVLSEFDGRRWSQLRYQAYRRDGVNWSGEPPAEWRQLIEARGDPLAYEVILEPTHQNWLYALATPESDKEGVGLTRDFRLISRERLRNREQYRVTSFLDYRIAVGGLEDSIRRRELYLPEGSNPRARERASQWMAQTRNPEAYIDRVLAHFNREFTYTLQPPALGRHSVDEFLWESKAGFCEHFASAFTVMMRAAGIPARVVVGYQGGEINPLKNFLVVRQADAHAWSEVWLAGKGWVRVDPTAAVAPERIEMGLNGALSIEETEMLDNTFGLDGNIPLFNLLRLRLEAMEYDWHRWVLSYDQDQQRGLLQSLLGDITAPRIALVLLLSALVSLVLVAAGFLPGRRFLARDPGQKLYRRFLRKLKTSGIQRRPEEGPRRLAERVAQQRPDLHAWVRRVTISYERYLYAGDSGALNRLRRAIKLKS